jgi:hypothetical protein
MKHSPVNHMPRPEQDPQAHSIGPDKFLAGRPAVSMQQTR